MFTRFDRQPPKLDATISVVAGEILDTEEDAAQLLGLAYLELRELRLAGQSPVPFLLLGDVAFYPRRHGVGNQPGPISEALSRARNLMGH
jgi:hypothetical protein